MDKVEALRSSTLLSALSDSELESLLGIVNERTFAPGEYLIRAGDTGALAMYVILDGKVQVSRKDNPLTTMGPGQHIGEMALLGPQDLARSADVMAVEPTTVLQLASWDLFTFLDSNPSVAKAIITELARRLTAADERLAAHMAGKA
jgi:CRP/FNR family transcriptional regulator, cyclic AMP receptor protein